MRKFFCLLLLVWGCLAVADAQMQNGNDANDPPATRLYSKHQKKYTFAIQPMQMFNWSLRLDFEIRLGDGLGWLQFGPAIYGSPNESTNYPKYYYDEYGDYHYPDVWFHLNLREPYSHMKGAGLDINYKRFVNPARSFYFAAGLSYTYFKIKYWGREWYDYIEDDLEYREYRLDYQDQQINRIGVNTYFGYQIPTRKAFLFDMFWGIAYRYSFYEKENPIFNEYMISYGRRGLVFLTGVRIGVGFMGKN